MVSAKQLTMTSLRSFISNIWRALGLIWQCSRSLTVASLVLVFVQSLLPLAGLYLMKMVVDAVASDRQFNFERVAILISLSAIIALLEILCSSVTGHHRLHA